MATVTVRCYGPLNDLLPAERRGRSFSVAIHGAPSVKDLVESLGVPHTEVDLILIDGEPVGFGTPVPPGARLAVYPRFAALDLDPLPRLRPPEPCPRRFVLDGHLGRLARYLRVLGFDTVYDPAANDPELARIAAEEDRILLTQDRGLLKRREVTHGYLVREADPRRQLVEVALRFDLLDDADPFRRCLRCNGRLLPVAREDVLDELKPLTRRYYDRFWRCAGCGQVYWEGSHYQRMLALIAWLREQVEAEAGNG